MNFRGKFEKITESTLTRYQQGGLMIGDVVKIKKNALNHPKIKEMGDNVKGNIKMLMDTDLHLRVKAIKSASRDGDPNVSDGMGMGYGATFSPTDFWIDIAVEHSPGFTTDPVSLPIEVLERIDFGANLPPIPDSQRRKGNINIKPVDASDYNNNRGEGGKSFNAGKPLGESMEDIYSKMQQPKSVTVRVPLEDSEETKAVLDNLGVTYSVIGPNRYELHGTIDNIQKSLNTIGGAQNGGVVDIEYVGAESNPANNATQSIPTDTGKPNNIQNDKENSQEKTKEPKKDDNQSLEEAYARITNGKDKTNLFTIAIPNAFADNVKTYLTQEGIANIATVDGNKTFIDIVTTSDKETVEEAIKQNVMGDLTYLKIYNSNQQISETR